MGKKDNMGRLFFADKELFAELINVHIYEGKQVVKGVHLKELPKSYPLYGTGGRDKERDILMGDTQNHVRYGLELETEPDYSIPERIQLYDACEYEEQVRKIMRNHKEKGEYHNFWEKKSRLLEEDRIKPVITLVLYLGEGRWEGRRHLSELFQIDEKTRMLLKQLPQDYHIRLIEADYVKPEQYTTELRAFFRAMQCRGDKCKLETEVRGGKKMCRAYEELKKDWRQEGRKEGRQEGRKEGIETGKTEEKFQVIQQMIKEGLDEALIQRVTRCTEAEYAKAVRAIREWK